MTCTQQSGHYNLANNHWVITTPLRYGYQAGFSVNDLVGGYPATHWKVERWVVPPGGQPFRAWESEEYHEWWANNTWHYTPPLQNDVRGYYRLIVDNTNNFVWYLDTYSIQYC